MKWIRKSQSKFQKLQFYKKLQLFLILYLVYLFMFPFFLWFKTTYIMCCTWLRREQMIEQKQDNTESANLLENRQRRDVKVSIQNSLVKVKHLQSCGASSLHLFFSKPWHFRRRTNASALKTSRKVDERAARFKSQI